jgi:hypothetical protein
MALQLLLALPPMVQAVLTIVLLVIIYRVYVWAVESGVMCTFPPYAMINPGKCLKTGAKALKKVGKTVVKGGKKVVKAVGTKKNKKKVKKFIRGKKSKKRSKKRRR